MNRSGPIYYSFSNYMNWIPEDRFGILISYTEALGQTELAGYMENILNSSIHKIRAEINRPQDEDDAVAWVNAYFRKRRLRAAGSDLSLEYEFNSNPEVWIIHRQMVEGNREDFLDGLLLKNISGAKTSYRSELERLLELYRLPERLSDDDYYSYLCMLINVAFPAMTDPAMLARVNEFAEYLISNRGEPHLKWLSSTHFMVLAQDLRMGGETVLEAYRDLASRHPPGYADYLGWMLALRNFGPAIRKMLSDLPVMGGLELLEIVSGA